MEHLERLLKEYRETTPDSKLDIRIINGEICLIGAYNLETCDIPKFVEVLHRHAFNHSENIENVKIPDGLKTIQRAVFSGCTNLKHIVIPDTVEYIGNNAFDSCSSLRVIKLPSSTCTVKADSFRYCTRLSQINVCTEPFDKRPKEDAQNMIEAYRNKAKLLGVDNFEFSVEDGSIKLDNVITDLEYYEVPGFVDYIGYEAFNNKINLKSVTINHGTIALYPSAFNNCYSLELIRIPSSLRFFYRGTFKKCDRLDDILIYTERGFDRHE